MFEIKNYDDAFEFTNKNLGWGTVKRPEVELKPVPYKKNILHDFLEGEEMTLLVGSDHNYYTVEDKMEPYGGYACTEFQLYKQFAEPEIILNALNT